MSELWLPPPSFPQMFPGQGNVPDNMLTRGVSAVREVFGITMAVYLLAVIFPGSHIPFGQKLSAYIYVVFATVETYRSRASNTRRMAILGHFIGFTLFTLGNAAFSLLVSHDSMRALFWAIWVPGIWVERATVFPREPRQLHILVPLSFMACILVSAYLAWELLAHTTAKSATEQLTAALLLTIPVAHVASINMIYLVSALNEQYRKAVARSVSALMEAREGSEHRLNIELAATQLQLERVNRSITLSALGASIAHDISQPLAAVVTNAGAATRWLADDNYNLAEARKALSHIVDDGHRASDVISSFRAMLKEEEQPRTPVRLGSLVREALSILHSDIQKYDIIVLTPSHREPPAVWGDRVQLRQVFLNLFSNAVDAMVDIIDRPRMLIIRCEQDDEMCVVVTVEDSGPGIAITEPARIFEAFFTTKSQGMGMGLFISRMITEAHSGTLKVESRPGRTKFYVSIPIENAHG